MKLLRDWKKRREEETKWLIAEANYFRLEDKFIRDIKTMLARRCNELFREDEDK